MRYQIDKCAPLKTTDTAVITIKQSLLSKGLKEEQVDQWIIDKLSLLDWALVGSFPTFEFAYDFFRVKTSSHSKTPIPSGIEHERLSALILGTRLK